MTARRIDQGKAVAASRALPSEVNGELRTRYRQLRVMLHTAGLAATYAYIASKAKETGDREDKLARAYQQTRSGIHLCLKDAGLLADSAAAARDVLGRLGEMGSVEYARASAEVAAFISWLSRLADAEWQEDDGRARPTSS
jgi:CRISPR/Cas system CMR-associated protein Cmr5 small subunit